MASHKFPDGFVWGAATAAYQIEGAVKKDGRGTSIWDTFAHTKGKVERDENGDIACDFYHRWPKDIELMAALGLRAFRFSIAWPRIFPNGDTRINPKGLDFYDRLVDELLKKDIVPYVTLYHWDLPQTLQNQGGWNKRDTALAFSRYVEIVGKRLGDRVRYWITHNEPMIVTMIGHLLGIHAPGQRNPWKVFSVATNILVSHGLAVKALRTVARSDANIGIVLNLSPIQPASDSEQDHLAAQKVDLATNRFFLDALLKGKLPDTFEKTFAIFRPKISATDLALACQSIDFLGINYYTRTVVRHNSFIPVINVSQVQPKGNEYSQMWEIYPDGMKNVLQRVWQEYLQPTNSKIRLIITENGLPVPDGVDADGRVRDERRIRYIKNHLLQVWQAIEAGIPVDGYFHWSLMDNFEWAHGYRMRFGLVYVDYQNQKRIIKDSGFWFRDVITQNGFST